MDVEQTKYPGVGNLSPLLALGGTQTEGLFVLFLQKVEGKWPVLPLRVRKAILYGDVEYLRMLLNQGFSLSPDQAARLDQYFDLPILGHVFKQSDPHEMAKTAIRQRLLTFVTSCSMRELKVLATYACTQGNTNFVNAITRNKRRVTVGDSMSLFTLAWMCGQTRLLQDMGISLIGHEEEILEYAHSRDVLKFVLENGHLALLQTLIRKRSNQKRPSFDIEWLIGNPYGAEMLACLVDWHPSGGCPYGMQNIPRETTIELTRIAVPSWLFQEMVLCYKHGRDDKLVQSFLYPPGRVGPAMINTAINVHDLDQPLFRMLLAYVIEMKWEIPMLPIIQKRDIQSLRTAVKLCERDVQYLWTATFTGQQDILEVVINAFEWTLDDINRVRSCDLKRRHRNIRRVFDEYYFRVSPYNFRPRRRDTNDVDDTRPIKRPRRG
jgi:hypothetical protein